MSNQPSPANGDDFTALPPSPAPIDEGVQREEPERPAPVPTSLLAEPRPLDLRRQPTHWERAGLWFLAGIILPAAALGSWFAGGNDIWRIGTALSVLILIILGLVALRHLGSLTRSNSVTFGFLLICGGVWFGIGHFWPLTTIQVKAGLGTKWEPRGHNAVAVRYDGTTMVELDRAQECAFSFRGRFDPKRLQIESLSPEGWIPRKFSDYSDSVSLEDIPVIWIYVDNRKHDPVVLSCGEVSFTIPEETQEIYRVPEFKRLLSCPVLLDGQKAGKLTDKNILVDTLGTHSYTLSTVVYGGALDMLLNKPAAGGDSVSLQKQHVHELPGTIDFFLEEAPKEIKVPTFGGIVLGPEKRTELLADDP